MNKYIKGIILFILSQTVIMAIFYMIQSIIEKSFIPITTELAVNQLSDGNMTYKSLNIAILTKELIINIGFIVSIILSAINIFLFYGYIRKNINISSFKEKV